MNCSECKQQIWAYLEGDLNSQEREAFLRAVQLCPECERSLATEQHLFAALRALPAPTLSRAKEEQLLNSVFADKAMAQKQNQPSMLGKQLQQAIAAFARPNIGAAFAAAAGLLVGVALTLGIQSTKQSAHNSALPAVATSATPAIEQLGQVLVSIDQEQLIRLRIASPEAFENVQFSVVLPSGFEFAGAPKQRELAWSGTLATGLNLLPLPVIARTQAAGDVIATVATNGTIRHFAVQISTVNQNPATEQLSPI